MKIRGKTVLVAGATRGIGLAIARKLAARGARLIIPWFDWPEDALAVAAEFARRSPEHLLVRADLRARDEVANLLQTVRRSCVCLHILVNNIERGGMPVVHGSYDRDINREQWQLEMDTILLAKRLLFEAALPLLRDAGQATVVNISSIAALVGRSGPAGLVFSDGYAAANRGISSLTATWARIGPSGVIFVSLAALADPELVGSAIARGLGGVAAGGGRELPDLFLEAVAEAGPILLVVDNFEHVIDAAPVVGPHRPMATVRGDDRALRVHSATRGRGAGHRFTRTAARRARRRRGRCA